MRPTEDDTQNPFTISRARIKLGENGLGKDRARARVYIEVNEYSEVV